MNANFGTAMRQALELTRAQKLMDATRVIQRALSGRGSVAPANDEPQGSLRLLEPPSPSADVHAPSAAAETEKVFTPPPQQASSLRARTRRPPEEAPRALRVRRPLGEVLKLLRDANLPGLAGAPAAPAILRKAPPVPVPDGAAFLTRTFACAAGSRDYKVYVPNDTCGRAPKLLVMLHGCTQNPDDFALGTGMNRLAEAHGFIVAYPGQTTRANPSACWNWFNPRDQMRDEGEPSIIAGITRDVMAEFGVDADRVFVAGLSAGGAMAAIMSATYPELYSAAGIHSGLPRGAAADLPSAFAAMRGAQNLPALAQSRRGGGVQGGVRTIVFHGVSDATVDPSNADAILANARAGLSGAAHEEHEGGIAGGRVYARTVITDVRGVPHAEHWAIEGLGHAWSGGSPQGSFTDAHGPDASREMLRFFLAS
jgi:poly(hydroxyalkanoate) depolymerase family esterase